MEILLYNGDNENKKELLLEKWKTDFANTFSGYLIPPGFDDLFLSNDCYSKCMMELAMDMPGYSVNTFLNQDITIEEVKKALDKVKLKKTPGIGGIPNEALKSPYLLEVPFCLFQTCFEYGIIPSPWYKSIIKPIPKSVKNDPRIPLKYSL